MYRFAEDVLLLVEYLKEYDFKISRHTTFRSSSQTPGGGEDSYVLDSCVQRDGTCKRQEDEMARGIGPSPERRRRHRPAGEH